MYCKIFTDSVVVLYSDKEFTQVHHNNEGTATKKQNKYNVM